MPSPAARATETTGFLAKPTDQIGVAGALAGGEITPEGDLYTGWADYRLRIGNDLRGWNQPTRSVSDPSLPLISGKLSDGGLDYAQTVFATDVADVPVAYLTLTAANRTRQSRATRVAMLVSYTRGREVRGARGQLTGAYRYERPAFPSADGYYAQPGESFSASSRYESRGRDVIRAGNLLMRGPSRPSVPLALSVSTSPTAPRSGRVFTLRIPPRRMVRLVWQIPLEAPLATRAFDAALDHVPLAQGLSRLRRVWRTELADSMTIDVPEPKVTDTYRAALVEMLESRFRTSTGWVQASNKLQYQALWLRDASIETQALDLAGLSRQAAQNLAFIDSLQNPDGLFVTRAGQLDGTGQALWATGEHAALTGDAEFASDQLERIGRAVAGVSRLTAADPLGLLPPTDPGDDELALGHLTGDDLWTAAGLRSASTTAELAGDAALAAAWGQVDTQFESALRHAVSAAVARDGHIPPMLDSSAGQDWGNYNAAYPVEIVPARSTAVTATLQWARDHMRQGLATYLDGQSLHDYLGFAIYQTEIEAGEPLSAVAGLYAELAHTTSTDNGWEWNVPVHGRPASDVNLSPHGTFAGDYVALLRNMLISERPDGSIDLLSAASPAWLAPGDHIAVRNAPTASGALSLVERSTSRGETLHWSQSRTDGGRLYWVLPPWARHIRVVGGSLVGRKVLLPIRSGTATVDFTGRRPGLSYYNAVTALDDLYRSEHQLAPIRPVR